MTFLVCAHWHFQVAGFFSSKSVTYEAQNKTKQKAKTPPKDKSQATQLHVILQVLKLVWLPLSNLSGIYFIIIF